MAGKNKKSYVYNGGPCKRKGYWGGIAEMNRVISQIKLSPEMSKAVAQSKDSAKKTIKKKGAESQLDSKIESK